MKTQNTSTTATSNKNAYEIRLDVLNMAKDLEMHNVYLRQEEIRINHEKNAEFLEYPEAVMANDKLFDKILGTANKLYSFIERK
jgi:hypothetical protein